MPPRMRLENGNGNGNGNGWHHAESHDDDDDKDGERLDTIQIRWMIRSLRYPHDLHARSSLVYTR